MEDPNITEELRIQEETAKLVFSPEYIPYFVDIQQEFKLSHIATLIYGFIRFYLKKGRQFYFTNSQLAEILNISESQVSKCFSEVEKSQLVKVHYQVKGGGGKVRFVDWVFGRLSENAHSDYAKTDSRLEATTTQKQTDNKNIKENKIKNDLKLRPDFLDNLSAKREKRLKPKTQFGSGYTPRPQYPQKKGAHGEDII